MNTKEFIVKLEEAISNFDGISEFKEVYSLCQDDIEQNVNHPKYPVKREDLARDQALLDAVGPFKQVLRKRCGSSADTLRFVYHFETPNLYLAIDAFYSSWDSPDFGNADWYEVKPVEVTSTEYRPL